MLRIALPYRAACARPSTLLPALLRKPQRFRPLFASHVVSLLGDEVSVIAIPLVAVLALNAGPAEMGLLGAAAGAPTLLFSLHAGAWLDRSGRSRESMVMADVGRALLTASIPVAWALGVLAAWQLYVVAFLTGTLSVMSSVSHSTVFASLVPRSLYLEANSLLQGGRALSRAFGSGLGGLLVQVLTAPIALFVDAISFLASALLLARTSVSPYDATQRPPDEQRATRRSVAVGMAWIARDRVIRSTLAAVATINFFLFGFYALFVLYATRILGLPPQALGLVLGGAAIGAVAGSVLTTPISRRLGIGPAFIVGCVAFPAPLISVAVAPETAPQSLSITLLFVAQLASGFGLMLVDVTGGTIRAALIPDELRARVAGAHMLVNKGVRPVGALAGGFAGSVIGLRPTLAITTLGATIAVLWLLPSSLPRLRTLPGESSS